MSANTQMCVRHDLPIPICASAAILFGVATCHCLGWSLGGRPGAHSFDFHFLAFAQSLSGRS